MTKPPKSEAMQKLPGHKHDGGGLLTTEVTRITPKSAFLEALEKMQGKRKDDLPPEIARIHGHSKR